MKKVCSIFAMLVFVLLCGVVTVSADEAGKVSFFKGSAEMDAFRPGEVIDVVYERSAGYKKGITLIAASYDKKGKLLDVQSVNDMYGKQQTLSVTMKTREQSDDIYKLKAMLVNSFTSFMPRQAAEEICRSDSVFSHPVYPVQGTESQIPALKRAVAVVAAMTDEQLKETIPKQTGMSTVRNPSTGNEISAVWDPLQPNVITDSNTGEIFPNDTYPNNDQQSFTNLRGNRVQIFSYKDNDSTRYYFNALIDQKKKLWLYTQLRNLSVLYHLTGEELYAQKTALILYEWSKYNPEYLNLKGDAWVSSTARGWDSNGKPLYGTKPYSLSEKRNEGRWMTEISDGLLYAYDLTYYSSAYEQLGSTARKDMEDNLLANRTDYVLLFPFDDINGSLLRNNLVNYVKCFVSTGRVLERPEYVHYAYRFCKEMLEYMVFTRDYYWAEGSSYLTTVTTTFGDTFERMKGYSDPPGYVSNITGSYRHINDAYQELERERIFFETTKNITPQKIVTPMGTSPSMHDTWSLAMTDASNRLKPLETSKNILLDGFGEAVLGSGTGADQLQMRLHFSNDQLGHAHADMMNLTLNAFGRYDLDDIGYNKSNYRSWTHYSLSHNTVVVDRTSYNATQKGNVTMFDDNELTSVVQVNDNGADGRPDLYRRTVVQNSIDEKHPYGIDIFEVSGGGKTHDYVLHGSGFSEQTFETDAAVTKMGAERPLLENGEVWTEPAKELAPIVGTGYGVFTNVYEKQQVQNDFYVDFQYKNPYAPVNGDAENPVYVIDERVRERWENSGLTEPYAGLRMHFIVDAADENTSLYIGDTPSLKLESLYPNEAPQTRQLKSLILRHRSDSEGMSSKFITVMEPYEYSRNIRRIEQLSVADNKNAVALKIVMDGGREDIAIIALDDDLGSVEATDGVNVYATDGRYALISKSNDEIYYHLYGGTGIDIDGNRVYGNAEEVISGEVLSIESGRDFENIMRVKGNVPDSAAGKYIIVNFAERIGSDSGKISGTAVKAKRSDVSFVYRIDSVERNNGVSMLHLAEETGIRETKDTTGEKTYTEIFYAWRVFSKEASYIIY